jgi:hypothetical protein
MAGDAFSIAVSLAPLVDNPASGTVIGKGGSELLFGEIFTVEAIEGEWCYGTSESDNYKGFVHSSYLGPATPHTHTVNRLWTHVYPEPDYKTRPLMGLGMMSRIKAGKTQGGFIEVPGYGWVFEAHLSTEADKNFVETALLFNGCPYLYGGRSAQGIDCSGLVQIALSRAGIKAPRDSGDQAKIGKDISRGIAARGDLVFFKGHVGIMLDEIQVLNATARSMDVRIESLADLEKTYGGIVAVKRI